MNEVFTPTFDQFILFSVGLWISTISYRNIRRQHRNAGREPGLLKRWAADREYRRIKAIEGLFVETGIGAEQVGTFSGPVIEAITKRRVARIREKELESRNFLAFCPCPACGTFGCHWLTKYGRECFSCGHKWRQR